MKGSILLSLLVLALSGSAEAQFWKDWFKPKQYKTTSISTTSTTCTTSTSTTSVSYYNAPSVTTFYSSYFYRYPTGTTYLPPPTFTPVVYYTPQPSCGTTSQAPVYSSTGAPYYVPSVTPSAQVIYPTPQVPSYTPYVPVATPTPSLVYYGVNQPYYPYAPTNTSAPVYPICPPGQPSVCATPTMVFTSPVCVATPTLPVVYQPPQPPVYPQPPIYVPPNQPQPSVYPQPPVYQPPVYQPQPPTDQPQPQPPVYQPQPPAYHPQPQPPVYEPQPQHPIYRPQPPQYHPQPQQPIYRPQPPVYQPQPPVYRPRPPMSPVCPRPPPFYPRSPVHPRPPIHRPRPLPQYPVGPQYQPTFPGHPLPPPQFPVHPQMPMRPFIKRRQLVCVNYRKVYTGLRLCKIRKLHLTNPIAIPIYVELLTQYFIAKKCHPSWNRGMCKRACLNFVAIEFQRKGVHGGWQEAFEHSFRLESSAALPSKFYNPMKAKRHIAAFQNINVHQCSAMPVHNIGQLIEYLKTIVRFNLMQAPGQPIGLLLQKTQTMVQQEAVSKGPIVQYAQAFIRSVCLKEWKAMKAAQRLH